MEIPSSLDPVFNVIPSTTELVDVTAVSHSLRPGSAVGKSYHHEAVDTAEPVLSLYRASAPKSGA